MSHAFDRYMRGKGTSTLEGWTCLGATLGRTQVHLSGVACRITVLADSGDAYLRIYPADRSGRLPEGSRMNYGAKFPVLRITASRSTPLPMRMAGSRQ